MANGIDGNVNVLADEQTLGGRDNLKRNLPQQ